ncbi:unnamed protein product [Alternaria alternata]|jgi:hypothetical protein|uniref:Uncharacterized protein n=2 Tax=Alternaria alternata complex TaxID=187734 RepID=A0A4Q4NMU3_ALTAL|nr:hypothetical protein AA0115_g7534 [Alternaria tenuissima]RYN78986.1 hypothetical protein AA0117_g3882 [Alternaria alternata]
MSSSQASEHAFDMFTDSTYFDEDVLPSADVPLPSIECTEDLSTNFFDSAFDIGFDNEDLHSDMSVWPADGLLECSDNREADPVDLASSLPSSGSIETLWRPLIGSDTINPALPATPTPSRAPTKHRAPKRKTSMSVKTTQKPRVTKAKKITKPEKAHKRTVSAPSSGPRSVQTLYTLPWSHLSQEEKGLLLLPLLQGIDPNTGEKIGEAGSLLPPPSFEMVTDDVFGTGDDGTNFMDKPSPLSTSSSAASTTIDLTGDDLDLFDKDIAVFRACQAFNIQHEAQKKNALPTVPDFNFDMPDFEFVETNWDIFDNFMPATQGLGGPDSNGVVGNSIRKVTTANENGNTGRALNLPDMMGTGLGQMPIPSGDYGRKRQQEALGRNAMLRAAGRRR